MLGIGLKMRAQALEEGKVCLRLPAADEADGAGLPRFTAGAMGAFFTWALPQQGQVTACASICSS